MANRRPFSKLLAAMGTCVLAACAQLPKAVADLGWQDHWGERGAGVLSRDYAMCTELVEQRRSLLQGCMDARGWSTATPD